MDPIRGLYAAGELVGGLFYFNYPGGSGLMAGTVFGKIAGNSAGRPPAKLIMNAAVRRPLNELGAAEVARKVAADEVTCEAVVRDCLARIDARDGAIKAWREFQSGACAGAGPCTRSRAEARTTARRAGRHQGYHRHLPDMPHRDGLADLS